MAYPKRGRKEDTNSESHTETPEARGPTVPEVGTPGVKGGAPKLSRERRVEAPKVEAPTLLKAMPVGEPKPMSRFFRDGPVEKDYKPLTPGGMPLQQVRQQFPEFVQSLQTELQKRFDSLPEGDRQSAFWQGFQQYKEWVPALMVRRMMANRMEAQGEVGKWMGWLEGLGK